MATMTAPVAGRLRRPGWRDPRLLIGLLLVALSIVAVSLVVRGADETEPVYAARGVLTPGTVLTHDDLVVANVRVGAGPYIPADADGPWGMVVTRTVGEGELLPADAVVVQADYDGRPVAVPASLPLAEGIERGALVDVWLTEETASGPESRLVGSGLVVAQVDRESRAFSVGATETVYVVVPADQMQDFLDAIATNGDISVVGLASSGS